MTKTLLISTAIALTLGAGSAGAAGFSPWHDRTTTADHATTAAVPAPAGFAPWRDRARVPDMNDPNTRLGSMPASAFRPWA